MPQEVLKACSGYAAALLGFGAYRDVLKVVGEWMDNNPDSWHETDEELSLTLK